MNNKRFIEIKDIPKPLQFGTAFSASEFNRMSMIKRLKSQQLFTHGNERKRLNKEIKKLERNILPVKLQGTIKFNLTIEL